MKAKSITVAASQAAAIAKRFAPVEAEAEHMNSSKVKKAGHRINVSHGLEIGKLAAP